MESRATTFSPADAPPVADTAAARTGGATGPPTRFAFVDGIRGFLALWITACHLVQVYFAHGTRWISPENLRWVELVFMGHDRTAFFFVVSGFCLMLPVIKDGGGTLRGGPRGFLTRRGLRLLPPYYLVLALVVAANALLWSAGEALPWGSPAADPLRWDGIVSHLILVHNLRPDWMYATYPPLWFVAMEWQAYLIFALVLMPVWRAALARKGTVFALGASLGVGAVLGYFWKFLPHPWNLAWTMPHYVFLFAVGMAAIAIAMAGEPALRRFRDGVPWTPLVMACVAAVSGLRWFFRVPISVADLFVAVIALGCLLQCAREYGAAAADAVRTGRMRPGAIRRFLESRPLTWVGRYSYSLFLAHFFVVAHVNALLERLPLGRGLFLAAFCVGNAVFIPLATALFYRFCEKPFETLRARTAARPDAATVAVRGPA